MKFSQSSFTVPMGGSDAFSEGLDRMPCSTPRCKLSFGHRGKHDINEETDPGIPAPLWDECQKGNHTNCPWNQEPLCSCTCHTSTP